MTSLLRKWFGFGNRTSRSVRREARKSFRPALESLEERAVPAVFMVTSTASSGAGTLAAAVAAANANPNNGATLDFIGFNIGGGGQQTIQFDDALVITDAVFISGYIQPGASVNTSHYGSNAQIAITLDGSTIPDENFEAGLLFQEGASGSIVRGLNIVNFEHYGLAVFGASDMSIEGNYIGIHHNGDNAAGNGIGVLIMGDSNTIGGTAHWQRNVISGNVNAGVALSGNGNVVQGNLIGTAESGGFAVANGTGVSITGASNVVGGHSSTEQANTISGNLSDGVSIWGDTATDNHIKGNLIGTTPGGFGTLGNGGNGVSLRGGAHDNFVGRSVAVGGQPLAKNTIAFNGGAGIFIEGASDNTIRLNEIRDNDGDGIRITDGAGNYLDRNQIYDNGGLGIDLGPDGVTPNDFGDGDGGANGMQNFPVLSHASYTQDAVNVIGTFQSKPNSSYLLNFYANTSANGPEGDVHLGVLSVLTDDVGKASFHFVYQGQLDAGLNRITATARDASSNTSEFSSAATLIAAPGTTANERFVRQAYLDILHRVADPAGLTSWVTFLAQGGTRSQVAQAFLTSMEYRQGLVDSLYLDYFGRHAEADGKIGWANYLAGGATQDQLKAQLLASEEFFQKSGGTNGNFLDHLYVEALDRVADPAGKNGWLAMLNGGATRLSVAQAFLASLEGDQTVVKDGYKTYLHRSADAGGLGGWSAALQGGMSDEQLFAALAGSDEYFSSL